MDSRRTAVASTTTKKPLDEQLALPDSSLLLVLNTTCETPLLLPTVLASSSNTTTTSANLMANWNSTNETLQPPLQEVDDVLVATWIYGLMIVSATAMLPVLGFAFQPFQRRRWFSNILLFFIAQTTFHLLSMSLLVYLPKSFKVDALSSSETRDQFIRIACAILVAILLSFNLEIFHCQSTPVSRNSHLKSVNNLAYYCWGRSTKQSAHENLMPTTTSAGTILPIDMSPMQQSFPITPTTMTENNEDDRTSSLVIAQRPGPADDLVQLNSASAFLYIFAECVVTFVDGFRIGSAIANGGLLNGIAVSFVIFTEETPRKIGGVLFLRLIGYLTIGQAIGCSMIASCFLFIGFVAGAFVCGYVYLKIIAPWTYALALAFFLHVCLVTVQPHILRSIVATLNMAPPTPKLLNRSSTYQSYRREMHVINLSRLLIVNFGFLIGFSISLVICLFAENLSYMAVL